MILNAHAGNQAEFQKVWDLYSPTIRIIQDAINGLKVAEKGFKKDSQVYKNVEKFYLDLFNLHYGSDPRIKEFL